jgi:hypothetical protein
MNFDFNVFIQEANQAFMKHEGNLRYGQFLYNFLWDKHPQIYNKITEELDCFYDDKKVPEFLRFLSSVTLD